MPVDLIMTPNKHTHAHAHTLRHKKAVTQMQLLDMLQKHFQRAGQSFGPCGLPRCCLVYLSSFFLSASLKKESLHTHTEKKWTHSHTQSYTQGCWEHEATATGTEVVISRDSYAHSHSCASLPAHKHTPTQPHMQAQSVKIGWGGCPPGCYSFCRGAKGPPQLLLAISSL